MSDIRLLELHAREYFGMGDSWHAHTFQAERNRADVTQTVYFRVVGCIAPLITQGPRIGKPNFRKHEKGTERTAYFTPQQQEEWETGWEQRTGQCRACVGEGAQLVRWSRTEGRKTRPCERCGGIGIYQQPSTSSTARA